MKCINSKCNKFAPKRDKQTDKYREQILCEKCVGLSLWDRIKILIEYIQEGGRWP